MSRVETQELGRPGGRAAVLLPHGGLRCHKLISGIISFPQKPWCPSVIATTPGKYRSQRNAWQLAASPGHSPNQLSVNHSVSLSFTLECSTNNASCMCLQCTMQVFAMHHISACKDSFPVEMAFRANHSLDHKVPCEVAEVPERWPGSLEGSYSYKGPGLTLVVGI